MSFTPSNIFMIIFQTFSSFFFKTFHRFFQFLSFFFKHFHRFFHFNSVSELFPIKVFSVSESFLFFGKNISVSFVVVFFIFVCFL